MEAPGPPTNTIFCLYCRATIYFPGLPANRYLNHLFAEHNIMYEVQSIINRTLALQLPKEYPELADGSNCMPDSSNRLTSPVPSSDDESSPAPAPYMRSNLGRQDTSTQTEPLNSHSVSCQAEISQMKIETEDMKMEIETEDSIDNAERVKRGCPKGGWPNKKRKTKAINYKQSNIRLLLEKSIAKKKSNFECELCRTTFNKIKRLKFHLMKVHADELSSKPNFKTEENVQDDIDKDLNQEKPERKCSRFVQKESEGNGFQSLIHQRQHDSTIPSYLQNAEADRWTEGCEYFCMLCSKSFNSFGVYKHHIGIGHGLLIEDYHAKFGRVGEIINKYTCKICHQEVNHKYSNIKLHMKTAHNLTLEEYNKKHNISVACENVVSTQENISNKSPDPLCEEIESMPATPVIDKAADSQTEDYADNISEGSGETEIGKKRWYEGCSYTCLACNKPYDIYFSYHGHIKKVHNMSMEIYHSTYGVEGEVNRYYSCKICQTNVVWRLFNVRKHMESQHNMSLDQYGSEYEAESHKQMKLHFKDSGRHSIDRKHSEVTDSFKPKEESKVQVRVWYEGCLFSCLAEGCKQIFNVKDLYIAHINEVHGITLDTYHAMYGNKGQVLQQYQCLICNAKIAHKYSNISSHMTLIHDLSIEEYEAEHLNQGSEASTETDMALKKIHAIESSPEIPIVQMSQLKLPEHFLPQEREERNTNLEVYEFTEEDIIIQDNVIDEDEDDEESIDDAEEVNIDGDLVIHEDPVDIEHAWYHGSMLTCQICRKTFANDQWYFHHFSKIHGMTKEQYNEKYGKEGEIWNQYQCLICDSEIRWKYSSIRQHLKQVHGTTIQDYEARYMDVEPEELPIPPLAALKEKALNPCTSYLSGPGSILKIPLTPKTSVLPPPPPLKASPAALAARKNMLTERASPQLPNKNVFTPPPTQVSCSKGSITFESRPASQWYHGSDLACEICAKSFVDFTYYCTHIRTTHQISKEQYNEQYGTINEAFRLYRCHVCGISIKWTYQSICGHLKSHELTIKEYETKYPYLENQSTESGKITDLMMNSNATVLTSVDNSSAAKKLKLNNGVPSLTPIVPTGEERKVPHLIQMQGRRPERISADVTSPTGKWYNQCKFTCKACPEEKYFTVPQALRMHLNGIHSLSRKEYESRYGGAETITKYWTCLICSKELKCQKGIIIQHLLNVHSMELIDYERQYMDAGDQVVARENRKPRKKREIKIAKPNESFADPTDLSSFLVQRMDEGIDNLSLEGSAVTEELPIDPPMDDNITSVSSLEVEGMEQVPWYFGCRYSCQICNKVWHYPQAARYHLDSVHKLTRAAYEAQYGTCEVETRIFHCSICQRTMKCERDIIKYHLEAKHTMSLENYIDQFPSPIVTIGESRRSNAATHARAVTPSMPMLQMFGQLAENSPQKSDIAFNGESGKVPWYRGSNFTCIPCNRNFTAQVSYISHINSKHGMNLREYREQFGSVEEIRQYMCKIPGCTRYVSWTYSGINDHLKSHNLTMNQYEQQYLGLGATSATVQFNESLDDVKMETEDFSSVVENWSNGYLRQCKLCKKNVVGSTHSFANHLGEAHQITLTEYTLQYGNTDNKVENHVCHLCSEVVEHEFENIKKHVEVHNITIEHYYHKFVGSTNTDATNAEIIIAKQNNESIPKFVIKPQTTAIFTSTSIKVRKNHWANGCSYQCLICKGQKFPEEFMFKKHILSAHNMTAEEYQNNIGDPALVKQLHICKVCNKDVKHEYTAILNHLRSKHNMTLTNYTQTHVRPVTTGPPPEPNSDLTETGTEDDLDTEEEDGAAAEDLFYIVYPDQDNGQQK